MESPKRFLGDVTVERHIGRSSLLWIIAGVVVVVIAGFLVWRAVYHEPAVTDHEARQFVSDIDSAVASKDTDLCALATFSKKCGRLLENNTQEISPAQKLEIVCSWPLKGGDGTRVVEANGEDSTGKKFRTSIAVSRDMGKLSAWPVPYWLYPSREIPAAGDASSTPSTFPDQVATDVSFDPCTIPGATN